MPQAPEPSVVIGFVAEWLRVDHVDQVESDPWSQMEQRRTLMERMRQPLERIAGLPAKQRVGELLRVRELRD